MAGDWTFCGDSLRLASQRHSPHLCSFPLPRQASPPAAREHGPTRRVQTYFPAFLTHSPNRTTPNTAPSLIKSRPPVKKLADLKTWPWIALAGFQFWSAKEIRLHHHRTGAEQTLPISPVLISEGVTSTWEAARSGLGVTLLPDWLIEDDLRTGRLVRLLPQWQPLPLPIHVVYLGQRLLPARVSTFIDFAVRYLTHELNLPRASGPAK